MKAMILAAGRGLRLRNITSEIPKPLTTLTNDLTFIDFTIQRLVKIGINNFIVNVHHLGEQIIDHIKFKYSNLNFSFSIEEELLGTGGGIAAAKELLLEGDDDDFLIINSDILHFIDLDKLIKEHRRSSSLASLVVKPSNEKISAVLYNQKDGFTGIYSSQGEFLFGQTGKEGPNDKYCTFTGIQIINRKLICSLPSGIYSIIKVYFDLVKQNGRVNIIPFKNEFWMDMGTPERMEFARKIILILNEKRCFSGKLDRIIINRLNKGNNSKILYQIIDVNDSWILIMNSNEREVNTFDKIKEFLSKYNSNPPKIIASGSDWFLIEYGGEKQVYSKLVEFIEKGI